MENLDLEWAVESTDLNEFKSGYVEKDYRNFDYAANGPDASGESEDEKSNEEITKNELESSFNKSKNVALAKKRLQAYTNKLQLKKTSVKPEKNEETDKTDKNLLRKSKKDYPDDRAKAVIQEIEELKKKEAKVGQETLDQFSKDLISREAFAVAIKNIHNLAVMARPRSRSLSSERDKQFRKREIKSRNYRRTDSHDRRSNSPEERKKKSHRSTISKRNYPKNWTEYFEEKLTTVKDEELKSKIFNQKTSSNIELCRKLYNFETPAPFLEPFQYSTETELKEVPFSHFRITRSHPRVAFGTNFQKNKESYINRNQLFHIIPNSRRQIIEKFINSCGKSHSTSKPLQTRNWYSRTWRKKDAECKVLENSVGLSFLQNYSDEEEEVDNEEIVICSSTKSNPKKEEPNMTISDIKEIQEKIVAKNDHIETCELKEEVKNISVKNESNKEEPKSETDRVEKVERNVEEKLELKSKEKEKGENEKSDEDCEPGEIIDDNESIQNDTKEYTPEKELLIKKMDKEDEIIKTKRAIKILEIELARRNDMNSEDACNKKEKSKRRKESSTEDMQEKRKNDKGKKMKKKVKKEESPISDNDIEKETKSKKKKKKTKTKIKDSSEDDKDSEDEKKTKKSKKKEKKEKLKKKPNKKETSAKESKSKSKDDTSEDEDTKSESKKRKKRPPVDAEVNDRKDERESGKKNKKKKARKSRDESSSSSSSGESVIEKHTKKDKSKLKKQKKKKHNIESENYPIIHSDERKKDTNKKFDSKKDDGLENCRKISESKEDGTFVEYTDLRQKLVAKSSKMKERKSKEKPDGKKHTDEIKSPKGKHDLRWELLENKRKRIEEELEEFPLEKDTYANSPSKNTETNTPDTDEYLGNWEKDSDAVWESEEDLPPITKEKLNTSWESDEEPCERSRGNTEIRSFKESLDLEIPLNIKPFTRRQETVIDPDRELKILKMESKNLSEERRRLEVEKIKVKELELRVIREMENKVKEQEIFDALSKSVEEKHKKSCTPDIQQIEKLEKDAELKKIDKNELEVGHDSKERTTEHLRKNVNTDADNIREKAKTEVIKPRRDRWDQKTATTSTPIKTSVDLTKLITPEKLNDVDDAIIISSSTEVHETSAVLENEYEQFIKAVSSDVTDGSETIELAVNKKSSKKSSAQKDSLLIPMPSDLKPVPVPSPKLEVDKIPSSLINLSLSANITLDITSKIDSPNRTSLNLISSPIPTSQIVPISKADSVVSSSTVDVKSTLVKDEKFSKITKLEVPNVDFQIGSMNNKIIVASANEDNIAKLGMKPLIFGGMTLPSKRSLLDNSNLKLGDSDEEEISNKPIKIMDVDDVKNEDETSMRKIEEIVQKIQEYIPIETVDKEPHVDGHHNRMRSRSPQTLRYSDVKQSKREDSPKKSIPIPRRYSPHCRSRKTDRNDSPVRRRSSPGRRYTSPRRSPRRRSPNRRTPDRKSPNRSRRSPNRRSPGRRSPIGKRRYSSRRSNSPKQRRRRGSVSPRRRSPKRSISPRASSAKRPRSRSPEKSHASWKSPEREKRTRVSATSPLERLKRSVADSTISDDLLPQPSHHLDEYSDSPISRFYDATMKIPDAPMKLSMTLGYMKEPPKTITTAYSSYDYQNNPYSDMNQYMNPIKTDILVDNVFPNDNSQNAFVQIGNMVEIVPRDLDIKTELDGSDNSQRIKTEDSTVKHQEMPRIVQVGNIVRIVPTEFQPEVIKPAAVPPLPPLPPKLVVPPKELEKIKSEVQKSELSPTLPMLQEKQSAEESLKLKIAERKAERDQRRQEKEKKRLEKEKRRKERESKRQTKMKLKTENMIKRALQLEVAAMAEDEPADETSIQWPPVPIVTGVSKDVGKSILMKGGFSTTNSTKADKMVKFADGVRPGEGTSPSGGEELSSPPPKKILPKEKRYTKTKLKNKTQKKKVKVKIVKKATAPAPPPELNVDDEDDDNLPPPSPPPGSPPPHLFPPRVKATVINNIHPSFVLAVQSVPPPPPPPIATSQHSNQFAQQQFHLQQQQQIQQQLQQQLHQQQQQLYNPAVSLLMAPPPPPPHHHHSGPPPPPHLHHPHGSPHHGPPMPPHHGPPPMSPHHGPPLPPGPGGHHHRPPPPGPAGAHHRPPYHF